jgi:MFS family permease
MSTAARLPMLRALLVCIINLNEAVAGNIIWPFLPFLAARYALPEDIGFYTGLLAASYFLGQTLFVTTWGMLADKWGRRPVMLFGLLGSSLTMLWFGFARSYTEALIARLVCGILNGNVAINKVYMAELTNSETQAQGFSWLTMTWGLGLIIAPTLGGFLADSSTQFPGSILDVPFTHLYPYALPSLVSSALGATLFLLALVFLQETESWLLRKQIIINNSSQEVVDEENEVEVVLAGTKGITAGARNAAPKNEGTTAGAGTMPVNAGTMPVKFNFQKAADEDADAADDENLDSEERGLLVLENEQVVIVPARTTTGAADTQDDLTTCLGVIFAHQIGRAIVAYGSLATVQILFDELLPLFCSTSTQRGGLGWQPSDVGVVQIGHGFAHIFCQLVLVPYVQRRYGLLTSFRASLLPLPLFLLLFPFVGFMSSWPAYAKTTVVLALALRALFFTVSFTSIMLLINNSTPAASLGFVTGVSQMVASFVRTVGPAIGGGVMSLGVATESLGSYRLFPVYAVMAILAIFTCFLSRGLVDCNQPPPPPPPLPPCLPQTLKAERKKTKQSVGK